MESHLLYIAKVTKSAVGADGRSIKCANETIGDEVGEVRPLSDGPIKFPVPQVGDYVAVWSFDPYNTYRYYLPVKLSFSSLTNDSNNLQIETHTAIDIEAPTINLGNENLESAVLGDTLVSILEDLIDAILAETHVETGGTTNTPLNANTFIAIKGQLNDMKSSQVKVGDK